MFVVRVRDFELLGEIGVLLAEGIEARLNGGHARLEAAASNRVTRASELLRAVVEKAPPVGPPALEFRQQLFAGDRHRTLV